MNKAYKQKLSYYGYIQENELDTLMYYQDAVMNELKNIDDIPNSFLETGGLKIYTTLNTEMQNAVQEILDLL